MKNKRGQLDEFSPAGALLGVIAGGIGLIITARMDGGMFLKLISFVICAIVGYFVGGKIAED